MVYSGLQFKGTIHYGGEGSQDGKSFKYMVKSQPQSGSREWQMDAPFLLFYSLGSQPGNGDTYRGQVFSPHHDHSHKHAQRPISQMIAASVKLRTLTHHINVIPVDCISFESLKIECLNWDMWKYKVYSGFQKLRGVATVGSWVMDTKLHTLERT